MDASRVFSNIPGGVGGGMFGLDNSLHNRHGAPTQPPAGNGSAMVPAFSAGNGSNPQTQLSMRQSYPQSDDEEAGGSANDLNDPKRKASSQWHRMKWTDTMVKLLIMAVYYIGDEAGTTATSSSDGHKGAKPPAAASSGTASAGVGSVQQQKKGKWKSVSRAMMEKGYCVSPQQCEDKFNDLNKRYKRVNDILGRGTACRVVENQSLLETMELSPKLKEEARKLLNSKHLFFREMCAYHNSCASAHHHSPQSPMDNHNSHTGQQHEHDHDHGHGHHHNEEDDDEEDEEEEEEEEFSYSEEDDAGEEGRKKARLLEIKGEVMGVIGDGSKTAPEKRMWLMGRMVELEEAGLKLQMEALEMEKERCKWARYCRKKEVEMEKKKLHNQRRRLENQRLMLLLRHKELQFAV